jgi:hypothetical protein
VLRLVCAVRLENQAFASIDCVAQSLLRGVFARVACRRKRAANIIMNSRGCLSFLVATFFTLPSAFAQEQPAEPLPSTASADADANGPSFAPPPEPAPVSPQLPPKVVPCTWRNEGCNYPHLTAAIDLGLSHFVEGGPFGFDTGVGSVTLLGPAWGARFGVELLPWFAIEAHYMGMFNQGKALMSEGGRRGLLTNAVVGELRFTVPTPYVQPYGFLGAGVYSTSVTGSSTTTQFEGSTEFGGPIGIGFSVLLPRGLTVGAEVAYHRLFGESFGEDEETGGGDPFTTNVVLRSRF